MKWLCCVVLSCLGSPISVYATVVTFANDYQGFVNAAGPLTVIDFETLPDGSPSLVGTEITEAFNYDSQGAHFSAPFPYPYITGNPMTDFQLTTFAPSPPPGQHTWLIADLTEPAYGVGAFFAGTTELCAFAFDDTLLGCVLYSQGGEGNFVGIVSDVPIARATFDDGSSSESIESFLFSPIPEPATAVLLASGLLISRVRQRADRGR